ncbi:hypothetical protein N8263_02700 [Flavobacteriaceae bacterium]|nr:hypothetical protein [Flavobacteriaceae bacterium]MDC1336576.1 hypothetical protein [Flavobacteriaceae bacterium]
MYNLGLDIVTSFITAALTECYSGNKVNVVSEPLNEQEIIVCNDLYKLALKSGKLKLKSGKQELFENIINQFI